MEHVVTSYVISDGEHYPLLNYGDVVLIKEGGYGLYPDDENKYVEITGYSPAGYAGCPGYSVKPYQNDLKTNVFNRTAGVESFGTNPMVLLNVHDNVGKTTHIKIEVLTAEFNYQGLYKGTVIDNAEMIPNGVKFKHNGKDWVLSKGSYLTFKDVVEEPVKSDMVNKPKHYAVFEELEAIEVIASSMTLEQFYGYCLGNILKYRLRAGGKDDVMQELGKADKYQELFTTHKHLCKDG